jgi:hypothetical protein
VTPFPRSRRELKTTFGWRRVMHTPLQLRFVSLAHPSRRAYSRSRHPLLSMFLVLAPLTCQPQNGFLRLFMTQHRCKKVQRFSVKCNADFASPSCVGRARHEMVQPGSVKSKRLAELGPLKRTSLSLADLSEKRFCDVRKNGGSDGTRTRGLLRDRQTSE